MSVRALSRISPRRRDLIFREILDLVRECDGVDRALQCSIDEGLVVDECLEEILKLLRSECKRAERRLSKRAA